MDTRHETKNSSQEWYTPPQIVQALGHFHLDPCAGPVPAPVHAERNIALPNDSLTAEWGDEYQRVWLNPPYGRQTGAWLKRMAEHGNGIALVFARTDTQMFFDHVWGKATGIFFIRGRLNFWYVNNKGELRASGGRGRSGAPSVLISYDQPGEWDNAQALRDSKLAGYFVDLTPTEVVWSGWRCAIRTILQFGPLAYPDLYRWVEATVHRPENKHIREKIRQTLNRHTELFEKLPDERWALINYEEEK